MATRSTRFILKNNANSAAPFSGATLLAGEPIVNTAAGIMMFSGVTSGTNDWVPAGSGGNANFFEVGSNLYNLKIRNQITHYNNVSNLAGKFLSGTTSGFVLADITSISGVDTYVTGFTYSNNVLTIKQNQGQSDLTATINTMTGLTVNGSFSATTYLGLPTDINVTGATYANNTFTFTNNTGGTFNVLFNTVTGLTVNGTLSATTANFGTLNVTTLNVTGGSITTAASNPNDIVNYSTLTGYSSTNDIYVTGGTISYTGPNGTITLGRKNASNVTINGLTDIYTTGGTYNAGTITLTNNDNSSFSVTGLTTNDTYVTGFTYTPASNTFTIKQNQGVSDLTAAFNTVSGLTVSNLTAGRVVYVGTSGLLKDESGFAYDESTNTFSVPSDGAVSVGTGGLSVAGDAVVQGNLTVFGTAISAFTSQLYVEDDNITLNYNPTGSTTSTSLGAGWTIQDGSGVHNTNTVFKIGQSYSNGNLSPNTEYTSATGNANRNFYTQLGDIIIRNTNDTASAPNGVRVLAENDILDGGTY